MSELGKELIEGMENALAYTRGQTVPGTRRSVVRVPRVDVRALRKRLDLSQKSFAETFGFSVSTVRNWEQGTRQPERAARILLAVIDRDPEGVREAVAEFEGWPGPSASRVSARRKETI